MRLPRLARFASLHAQPPSGIVDHEETVPLVTVVFEGLGLSNIAIHCIHIIIMSIRYRAVLCSTCHPPNSTMLFPLSDWSL